MNANALFWISCVGLLATLFAAIESKAMQALPWHDLQEYCQKRKRRSRFDEIYDAADDVAAGAETLLFLSVGVFIVAAIGWASHSVNGLFSNPGRFALMLAVSIPVLLATTSWIPLAVAELWSPVFVFHTWQFWKLTTRILRPFFMGASAAMTVLRRLKGQTEVPTDEEAFEDEIRTMVAEGRQDGYFAPHAVEMIQAVMELDDGDVAEIMTSRSDIDAMPVDLGWDEILDYVVEVGRTRIPVYEGSLDQVLGILYVKDLFAELKLPLQQRRPLRDILRPRWDVPMRQRLDELLKNFLKTRNHLAIVLDEYQAVAGLVTIEDVLEVIVGEIVDESDEEEDNVEIQIVDETTILAQGRTHLYKINEHFATELPEDAEFDTIGGLMMRELQRIPQVNDFVVWRNLRITAVEASRRRVEMVRIELVAEVLS